MNKKLQVFVSSTYTDLIEERQAAVQAILDAGHIPAGMELFTPDNETQLQTIYRWIDESHVYMLILGGRYGSVESKSGKSYTQLEYEYALSKDIPIFTVVLSESFITQKINTLGLKNVMEQSALDKYYIFKEVIMSKTIKMVDDCKDIKLVIYPTLNNFINKYNLTGWVRNNINKKQIQLTSDDIDEKYFNNLEVSLQNKIFTIPKIYTASGENVSHNALKLFLQFYDTFSTGIDITGESPLTLYGYYKIFPYYENLGLVEIINAVSDNEYGIVQKTKIGQDFYKRIRSKYQQKS